MSLVLLAMTSFVDWLALIAIQQAGGDLIRGGNGRDIIDGGSGSDELR